MYHFHRIAAVTVALTAAAIATAPAHAQAHLFSKERDTRNYQAQVYDATVRKGVNATLSAWHDAWASGDADALAGLYLKDATLFTPEGTIRGRDAISDYYRRLLPATAALRSFPLSFNASGVLAYNLQLNTVQSANGTTVRSQRDFMVLRQQWDDTWLIETQMLADVEGAAAAH